MSKEVKERIEFFENLALKAKIKSERNSALKRVRFKNVVMDDNTTPEENRQNFTQIVDTIRTRLAKILLPSEITKVLQSFDQSSYKRLLQVLPEIIRTYPFQREITTSNDFLKYAKKVIERLQSNSVEVEVKELSESLRAQITTLVDALGEKNLITGQFQGQLLQQIQNLNEVTVYQQEKIQQMADNLQQATTYTDALGRVNPFINSLNNPLNTPTHTPTQPVEETKEETQGTKRRSNSDTASIRTLDPEMDTYLEDWISKIKENVTGSRAFEHYWDVGILLEFPRNKYTTYTPLKRDLRRMVRILEKYQGDKNFTKQDLSTINELTDNNFAKVEDYFIQLFRLSEVEYVEESDDDSL